MRKDLEKRRGVAASIRERSDGRTKADISPKRKVPKVPKLPRGKEKEKENVEGPTVPSGERLRGSS